jgi:outer membrane protein TolC
MRTLKLFRTLAAGAAVLYMACPAFGADEPAPPPVPAVEDASPADVAASAETSGLKEQISADLIDLSALQKAAEEQLNRTQERMSLDDVVKAALRQNPDIIIASMEPGKAEADVYTAGGEFDPMAQFSLKRSRAIAATNSQIQAITGVDTIGSTNNEGVAGLGGKLVYGTQYALQGTWGYEESSYGNLGKQYNAMLGLTLTQPVLRGFGKKYGTVRIEQAKNMRTMSDAQLRLAMLNIIGDVVKSYWNLVGSVEAVKVAQESLRNAERLMQINEARRRIGTAADIEVLQSKAGVAVRQSEWIATTTRSADASDMLKQQLALQDGGFFSKAIIVPTDRPNPSNGGLFDFTNYDESLDASVKRALVNRPEITMSDMELANSQLEVYKSRNEMMPQFDVVGAYGQAGRDETQSRALQGIWDKQNFSYSIGVQGAVAINNRAARGANTRARITERQSEERRKQTEIALQTAVHVAARGVKTNQILVESNRQAVRLQEANVTAEEKRLRLGVTTSFQVLQIQQDLTTARLQELRALISYETALVDLQIADGSLLDNLGIKLEVSDTETPVGYWESIRPRWE